MTRKRHTGFLASIGLVTVVVGTLAACGGGATRSGEEAFRETALAVDGVVSAGSLVVGAGAAGFPAVPTIREVCARYGIAPGEGLTE